MAIATAELVWVTNLLHELRSPPPSRCILFCDNKSALFHGHNLMAHKHVKHTNFDYHFVRNLVFSNKLVTRLVQSHIHLADISHIHLADIFKKY